MKAKTRRIISIAGTIFLCVCLLASVALNVYMMYFKSNYYLQSHDEIYIMEAGILKNNLRFREGEDIIIEYDMDAPEYKTLLEKYPIREIAGEGTELERAMRLMHEYSPRLAHMSNYGNDIEISALPLLEYSLDNKQHGINCRNKAQILNEMCLALGIYSRKIWLMPYSTYDADCHVVNEIWDSSLKKWVMLDITNDLYWVDGTGAPLSAVEIRNKGATSAFCTPIAPGESFSDPAGLKSRHKDNFIYIMKNMFSFRYLGRYTSNEEGAVYQLFPENDDRAEENLISLSSVQRSPEM